MNGIIITVVLCLYIFQIIGAIMYLLIEKFDSKKEFIIAITPVWIFITIYSKLKELD